MTEIPILAVGPALLTPDLDKAVAKPQNVVVDTTSRGEKVMPKPETPFLDDMGLGFPPALETSRQKMHTGVENYYREKSDYQNSHLKAAFESGVTFSQYSVSRPSSADSLSTFSSTSDSYETISGWGSGNVEVTLEQSGYHRLSDSLQLVPDNEVVARYSRLEHWYKTTQVEEDGESAPVVTFLDAKGRVNGSIKRADVGKELEKVQLLQELSVAKAEVANSSRQESIKQTKSNLKSTGENSKASETQIEKNGRSKYPYVPFLSHDLSKWFPPKESNGKTI